MHTTHSMHGNLLPTLEPGIFEPQTKRMGMFRAVTRIVQRTWFV